MPRRSRISSASLMQARVATVAPPHMVSVTHRRRRFLLSVLSVWVTVVLVVTGLMLMVMRSMGMILSGSGKLDILPK